LAADIAKPRALLHSTLEWIYPNIRDSEFKLLTSGPCLKRQAKDFTFEVAFQGWKWNAAGEAARFHLVASVHNKSLKTWRNAQPIPLKAMHGPQDGFVAARSFIDPLNDDYYSWNLFESQADGSIADRLLRVINDECLSFFAGCMDPRGIAHLQLFPDIFGSSFVELALAKGDIRLATETVHLILNRLEPSDRQTVRDLLNQLQPNDFPQVTGSRSNLGFLAGVILLNNLPVVVPT
jgi:hypothetical protein